MPEEINAFRKSFDDLLEKAGVEQLVVLIDDLDRCLPDTAIETLEAVRLFVFTSRTAFVIAADEAMIEYAVRKHFPDLPYTTGPQTYARNYLEKLIQVPFRIPALGDTETRIYVTLLLVGAELGEKDEPFNALINVSRERLKRPWMSAALDAATIRTALGDKARRANNALALSNQIAPILASGTNGNPHQIKRFLNTLVLRQRTAEAWGFGDEVKLPIIAKLMLAERFLPRLFDQIAAAAATAADGKCPDLAALEAAVITKKAAKGAIKPKKAAGKGADTKDLLFSMVFDLMSQVVSGSYKSVHAAYQATKEDISVSITSVYNKLNGIEPGTSAQLVHYAIEQVEPIIRELGGTVHPLFPGKRIKLLDGNCIEKSQHRIKEFRTIASGPLPGKSLVVYDPELRLPIYVIPCEDGHAQERSLLKAVYPTIETDDVWVTGRNFCIVEFTSKISIQGAYFAIREHKKYPFQLLGKEQYLGKVETGTVYEQPILVRDHADREYTFRRTRVKRLQRVPIVQFPFGFQNTCLSWEAPTGQGVGPDDLDWQDYGTLCQNCRRSGSGGFLSPRRPLKPQFDHRSGAPQRDDEG